MTILAFNSLSPQAFDGVDDTEITLHQDQRVWILPLSTNQGWCEVMTLHGVRGYAPANFMERIEVRAHAFYAHEKTPFFASTASVIVV